MLSESQFLTAVILSVLGLGYCLWRTQADYRAHGFGWITWWGVAAILSAFLFVVILLTAQALSDL